jgi:hypothetical protein
MASKAPILTKTGSLGEINTSSSVDLASTIQGITDERELDLIIQLIENGNDVNKVLNKAIDAKLKAIFKENADTNTSMDDTELNKILADEKVFIIEKAKEHRAKIKTFFKLIARAPSPQDLDEYADLIDYHKQIVLGVSDATPLKLNPVQLEKALTIQYNVLAELEQSKNSPVNVENLLGFLDVVSEVSSNISISPSSSEISPVVNLVNREVSRESVTAESRIIKAKEFIKATEALREKYPSRTYKS